MATLGISGISYGDMRGDAAGDFDENRHLSEMVRQCGLDGLPVALSFTALGDSDQHLTIYVSDCRTFEEVEACAKSHDGVLQVRPCALRDMALHEFLRCFKRLSIIMQRSFQNVKRLEPIGD